MFEDERDVKYGEGKWHCDHWIDSKLGPDFLTAYLEYERQPAAWKYATDWYRKAVNGSSTPFPEGWPKSDPGPVWAVYQGKWVRLVMVSRFGDVGLSHNLDAESGYFVRVALPELDQFTNQRPTQVSPPKWKAEGDS